MRTPAVPPDAPLNMRVQSLRKAPGRPPLYTSLRTHLARLIAFGGALAIGSLGTWHMLKAFGDGRSTLLQYVLLVFFALTFYWVAFSTTACLAGFLPLRRPKSALDPNGGKVALVMPVYGEDPAMTHAASPTPKNPTPGLAKPRHYTSCANNRRYPCGTAAAHKTSDANPATSKTSCAAGAAATPTWSCLTPTA